MPELPEVETIVRQLAPRLAGARVARLEVLDPRLAVPPADRHRLAGVTLGAPARRGKAILLPAAAGGPSLVVHLRMTGRLALHPPGAPVPRAHLRARLRLDRGTLAFHDVRRFGTLRVLDDPAAALPAGDDPLAPGFTAARLAALLGASRQPLKPWLLRQDRLAGLGNIYASEICHAARLDPRRPAGSLAPAEVRRLHRALRAVLRAAVAHRGTTFSDYRAADGEPGGHQRHLRVYGRAGAPCPRCRAPVERLLQAQRSTFYCPRCQGAAPPRRP